MNVGPKTKNSMYVFTCTAAHLKSSFVPAVGHLTPGVGRGEGGKKGTAGND